MTTPQTEREKQKGFIGRLYGVTVLPETPQEWAEFCDAEVKREVLGVLEEVYQNTLLIDCEPECTPVRHALHEGSWETHQSMLDAIDAIKKRYQ